MKLWEVMVSGKEFRRLGWKGYCSTGYDLKVSPDDMQATDWELKPETQSRLYAYIVDSKTIHFSVHPEIKLQYWVRAPWLDEPEKK